MIWILYNLLFVVGFTLLLPHFFWRMWKRGGYRRDFGQRLGWFSTETRAALAGGKTVWIHAVSVGELFVALRLMDALRAAKPDISFVVTTTTSTGHAIAKEKIRAPDVLLYFPVDLPMVMRRVLDVVRPKLLILVEVEFWPNLIRLCHQRGIPVTLVNGRISDSSYRGYRRLRLFTRRVLPLIRWMSMQSDRDAERIRDLGAPPSHVMVAGSAKYELGARDADAEAKAREALRQAGLASATVLLGGSTWAGEEAILLDLYAQLRQTIPDLALVLAPRHVERSKEVIEELERRKLHFYRRSQLPMTDQRPDVLLIDTTGELRHFYAAADVIFIGKSLTFHGGQNLIEPAVYGKAIVVGPNMENFAAIMADFHAAQAVRQVADAQELESAIRALLADSTQRQEQGARARRLVEEKSGAIEKTVAQLLPLLP